MRTLFALWALPLLVFWGWYFLSLNDINFGYIMLTRQLHDAIFELYGEILGVPPGQVPLLIARAFAFDTLLLVAFWAFRRRREIAAWVRRRRAGVNPAALAPPVAAAGPAPLEG